MSLKGPHNFMITALGQSMKWSYILNPTLSNPRLVRARYKQIVKDNNMKGSDF